MKGKIKSAAVQFLLSEPFFSRFMVGRLVESKTIRTMGTDMQNIYYNTDWVDQLTTDEIKGVILHEILHIVYKHGLRRGNRDPKVWNMAADFVVNKDVLDHGYTIPEGGLVDNRFDGLSTEQIYNILMEMNPPPSGDGGEGGEGEGGSPDGNPDPGGEGGVPVLSDDLMDPELTPEEMEALSQEISTDIVAAAQMCEQEGRTATPLQKRLYKSVEPKINWRAYLHQFVSATDRSDYSWKKRNRRYSGKFYLPALHKEVMGEVILAVDTSGSINEDLLSEFIGEINGVKEQMRVKMEIVYCDTSVRKTEVFDVGEYLDFEPAGGGGTRFSPVMKYVSDRDESPECVIYFTDGYCNDFGEDPEVPVLWAVYDNNSFTPPFGEVIYLEL